jgi:hypothetical protein
MFQNDVISAISSKFLTYKKLFPPAFFNILKEPLLVQNQTISQKKGLILSFFQAGKLWYYQEGSTPTFCKKGIEQK